MSMALELNGIQKVFNRGTVNEKLALNNLNLKLEDGDFITIIGGNGAGKSTMLNAISGVWPVDAGKIIIGGRDVTNLAEHKRAAYLGRVFQDPMTGTAATMDIEENMALAVRRGQKRRLRWGITQKERDYFRSELEKLGLGLEDRLTTKVGLLSGGQRQAITLLMASMKRPDLLNTSTVIYTVMIVTHNMRDAIKHGNRLIMMHEGHIIYDVRGEEKSRLEVKDLLARFEEASGGEFANDRMMLA